MEPVLRTVAIYVALMVLFRMSGKRSLSEVTTFDFILLLIISEATQQALLGQDYSLTTALLVILTLVGLDIGMSLVKQRSQRITRILEGVPLVIVDEGRVLSERLKKARIDEEDILTAARKDHGLERLDDVKYAVLERNGGISIVPRKPS